MAKDTVITYEEWMKELGRVEKVGGAEKAKVENALYKKAVGLVVQGHNARNTFLRYKLGISQHKAAALIERMTDEGILGPYKGSNKPREILR